MGETEIEVPLIWQADGKRRHTAAKLTWLVQPTVVVVNWCSPAGGVSGGERASVPPLSTPSCRVVTSPQPTGELRRRTESPPEMSASILKFDSGAVPLERSGWGRNTSLLVNVSTLITRPCNGRVRSALDYSSMKEISETKEFGSPE